MAGSSGEPGEQLNGGCLNIIGLLLGCALVAIGVAAVQGDADSTQTGYGILVGGGLLAAVSLSSIFSERSVRWSCPGCQQGLGAIEDWSRAIHCGSCNRFIEVVNAALAVVEESRVAAAPIFMVPPTADPVFPSGCAVCGAPATRKIEVVRAGDFDSLFVPHCAEHTDGVKLAFEDIEKRPLCFRSLPTLREFCRLNRIWLDLPLP
jgi:hypothetical protein